MRLHILLTGFVSKTSRSGGDQLILDLIPYLPKEWEIIVITPRFAKEHFKGVSHPNLTFRYLGQNIFDLKTAPIWVFCSYVIRAIQTYSILVREKVSLIYSCSDIAYGDIWPAFFLTINQRKISWITRVYHVLLPTGQRQGSYLVNLVAFWLQRLSFWMMIKMSSRILALNGPLREQLTQLGFPVSKTGLLGGSVDYAKIASFKPTKKYDYTAVVLGRIAPVKGIFDAVQIWKKVHDHNSAWKLAWVGEGSAYVTQLKRLLNSEGLEESFALLGFLPKREVLEIFKSAKVFLCPDHENGWGLAVLEAMAAGLPVVSYNIDIFGGVYKKGYLSSKLFDTDAFSANLIKVLEDQKLAKKLSTEAKIEASFFGHEKVVKSLVRVIEETVSSN